MPDKQLKKKIGHLSDVVDRRVTLNVIKIHVFRDSQVARGETHKNCLLPERHSAVPRACVLKWSPYSMWESFS